MPLFDSDFLSRLEYLSLVSKRLFQGRLIAQRRTHQLGAGIEFADHREYAAGDDMRYLDWNVFARHDQLLLKRFHEDEDLHVYLLIDASRSMAFGTPSKFDHARRLAAALAYIALADLDRVAITAFADRIIDDLPLTRGKGRILGLMEFLERLEPAGTDTSLADTAHAFVRRPHRRGPVIVLSDLCDPEGFERGIDLLRHHRYEPHLVHLSDPAEAAPNMLGDLELVDRETGNTRKVTIDEQTLKRYREIYEAFVDSIQRYCRRYALSFTSASTATPFDEQILKMMRVTEVVQ